MGFKLLIMKIIDEVFILHLTNLCFSIFSEKVFYVLGSPVISETDNQRPTFHIFYIFLFERILEVFLFPFRHIITRRI